MSDEAKAATPYRTEALVVAPEPPPERAFCPWCSSNIVGLCCSPAKRRPGGERRYACHINTTGKCEEYTPSALTRLVRIVGLRSPVPLTKPS